MHFHSIQNKSSAMLPLKKKQRKPFWDPETAAEQKNQSDLNTSDQIVLTTLTLHNLKQ